jgi:outer membrane protein insertion porin family
MLNRICLISAFIFLNISLFAQSQDSINAILNYTETKDYIIQDVKVTGVNFTDPKILVQMTGLVVGSSIKIPGDAITKVVEKFWDHGLFSDIKVIATKIEGDKIWLEVNLKEKPRVSTFNIRGVKKGEADDLKEKLDIKPGNQLTDNVLNTIRNVIQKHYKEKGFLNTQVTFKQTPDSIYADSRVKLTAYVNKKEKVKISKIIFEGNTHFKESRLHRALKKTKQKSFNIFRSSKFIEANYKEDKKNLADFFKKNGYRDYKFISDSISYVNPSRIKLHIKIEEGKQFHIRNLTWVGNTKYPSEMLDKILLMKRGDVYDQITLQKRLISDEDAVLGQAYQDNGYLFAYIDIVESNIENDSIDIELHVTEGRQATINRIIILGNDKTNEHVVRRELYTRPGDLFSKSDIIRSVRQLGQLGYFNPEKIEPVPIPNQTDGTVDIQYKLEEKSSDQLEVSGGWGAGMLVGTLGLKFNNFSARNIFNPKAWRPVPSGDGQSLSLRAQSNGSWYKAYSMSFSDPWFGGKKPNSFSFSLYRTIQNSKSTSLLKSSSQSFKVTGASIGLGRRLTWPDDNFTLYNELSYQYYALENYSTGGFMFSTGTSNNLSFKIALSRNTTDQPIYPRGGSNFTISLQLTPPYSAFKKDEFWKLYEGEQALLKEKVYYEAEKNGDVSNAEGLYAEALYNKEQSTKYKWIEYNKWEVKANWYNQLFKKCVLSFNAQFGYLGYYSAKLGYSPFEGYVLGGDGFSGYSLYGKSTIGLRGYENESLTPSILTYYYSNGVKNAYYSKVANIYNKATIEVRYPITLQPSATIYGLIFVEGGNSWYDYKDFSPFAMKRSAGFGIRAYLPMFGLLGIHWGYGFDSAFGQTGRSGGQFHFEMGQQL